MRSLVFASLLLAQSALASDDFDEHQLYAALHPGLIQIDLADGGTDTSTVGWHGGFGGGVYRLLGDSVAVTGGLAFDYSSHGLKGAEGTLNRWRIGPEGRVGWHKESLFVFGVAGLLFGEANWKSLGWSVTLGGMSFVVGGGAWVRVHQYVIVGGELRTGFETLYQKGTLDGLIVPLQLRGTVAFPF